ncbi:hypothetical protein Drorol1_Dr00005171 [Drosera rotundifolia]
MIQKKNLQKKFCRDLGFRIIFGRVFLTPPPRLRLQPSPSVSPSTDFTHHNHHVSLLPQPPDPPSPAATAASSPFDEQRGLRPSNEGTHTPGRGALAGESFVCRGAEPCRGAVRIRPKLPKCRGVDSPLGREQAFFYWVGDKCHAGLLSLGLRAGLQPSCRGADLLGRELSRAAGRLSSSMDRHNFIGLWVFLRLTSHESCVSAMFSRIQLLSPEVKATWFFSYGASLLHKLIFSSLLVMFGSAYYHVRPGKFVFYRITPLRSSFQSCSPLEHR